MKTIAEHARISALIKQIDAEFLSIFFAKDDIDEYIDKIIERAVLFEITKNGILIGLLAMYCNDLTARMAYITMIAVDKSARGRGLAAALMRVAIDYAKCESFEKISLETRKSNRAMLSFYEGFGFEIAMEHTDSFILDLKLAG